MEQGQQEYSLQATLALRQISTVSVHSSTVQYCILSKKTQTQRGAGMKHFLYQYHVDGTYLKASLPAFNNLRSKLFKFIICIVFVFFFV